uniref:Uncharacterized protein n=1 Tax=Candidatus Kentrum sp. DK TaxID=2126562 RepID=A0A450TFK4_9GAMM|nr:MAG: hypothetical protein BECKDK2373B_GA0170837_11573 [Candidatus Kentron sp. DK]
MLSGKEIGKKIINSLGWILSTVLGAVIIVGVKDYAIPYFKNGFSEQKIWTIVGGGVGNDISLHTVVGNSDFTDDDISTYDFSGAEIKIDSENNVSFSSNMLMNNPSNDRKILGRITGNGIYVDGIAYVIYSAKAEGEIKDWKGVAILKISKSGSIIGYWITEDTRKKGKFSFGSLNLDGKSTWMQ